MIGQVFGRLTVISEASPFLDKKGMNKGKQFVCQCSCGVTKTLRSIKLTSGNDKSCGCLKKEKSLNWKKVKENLALQRIKRKQHKLLSFKRKPSPTELYWIDAEYKKKILEKCREQHKKSPHLLIARKAKRRATKLNATPKWLSKEHHEQIQSMYALAKKLTKITGDIYHVDHIIPLQGKDVCGLHVPWNLQVIKAIDNLRKGNKIAA